MLFGYNNLFDTASVITPNNTPATGFEIQNAYDWRLVTWWQSSVAASYMTVTLDMGSAVSADYVAMAGHNVFSTLGANAKISVHGSTDNFSASDVTVATFDVDTDGPILGTFNSASYRYWRITIYETGLATHQSLVGHLCLGARYSAPAELRAGLKLPYEAIKDDIRNNVAQKGNHIGRSVISQGVGSRLEVDLLDMTEVRGNIRTFLAHAVKKPFFFVMDEVNYPNDVVWMWTEGQIDTPGGGSQYQKIGFNYNGVIT